jgi:peptide/nickel transport system ATP-binding protein
MTIGVTPRVSSPVVPQVAPLLRVEHLTRSFGSAANPVLAVKDVSFELQPREIIAIVGESGSGKSTLARLILRLLPITSGRISFEGEDHTRTNTQAYWRKVQAVFQDPFAAFNQFYTVRRVLMQGSRLVAGLTEAERNKRMKDALLSVGMDPEEMLDKTPYQLSGGQKQRVMIARALMLQPKLLIADEPTSMLDASLRVSILNLLKDIRDQYGMSILFITHDIGQAYYVSDRLLVMYQGEVVEQGKTEEVIAQAKHPYTQRLMSDVPKLHG